MEVNILSSREKKKKEREDKVEFALLLSLDLCFSKPTDLSGRAGNGEYLWKVNFKLRHEY